MIKLTSIFRWYEESPSRLHGGQILHEWAVNSFLVQYYMYLTQWKRKVTVSSTQRVFIDVSECLPKHWCFSEHWKYISFLDTLNIHKARLVLLLLNYNVYHCKHSCALEPIMVEEMGHSNRFWTWCRNFVWCNRVNSVWLRLRSHYAQEVKLNRKNT